MSEPDRDRPPATPHANSQGPVAPDAARPDPPGPHRRGRALAIGATRPSTVELAAPTERAGLPQASQVLVESAALVCPGQQRVGTQGMRDLAGSVQVTAAAAPEAALAGLPPAAPDRGQVSLFDPSGRTMASTDQRFEPPGR